MTVRTIPMIMRMSTTMAVRMPMVLVPMHLPVAMMMPLARGAIAMRARVFVKD